MKGHNTDERSRNLLYSGSVKNVYSLENEESLIFEFSDRYSIFDWGEMPDLIPHKGESLAMMGNLFFQFLGDKKNWESWTLPSNYPKYFIDSLLSSSQWKKIREKGLSHHSLGLVDEGGNSVDIHAKTNRLKVKKFFRPKVEANETTYDYSAYKEKVENTMVPLEVVFRFGAPQGSSFLQRLEKIDQYEKTFGFAERPRPDTLFAFPIVEFFTKFESTDRFLTLDEAMKISGLSKTEMDHLISIVLLSAIRLRDLFLSTGLELWDGKFEFAYLAKNEEGVRELTMVDSIGPDEIRLIGKNHVHLSKEALRAWYRKTKWYENLEKAKNIAKEKNTLDWKKICKEDLASEPEPLPKEGREIIEKLYPSITNAISKQVIGRTLFSEGVSIEEMCGLLKGVSQ
ncbi:MAG: hypothetical protein M9962_01755 [Oligoflexia bacterium]|nr:hypothetical protein [Oligoflexia bacterium]